MSNADAREEQVNPELRRLRALEDAVVTLFAGARDVPGADDDALAADSSLWRAVENHLPPERMPVPGTPVPRVPKLPWDDDGDGDDAPPVGDDEPGEPVRHSPQRVVDDLLDDGDGNGELELEDGEEAADSEPGLREDLQELGALADAAATEALTDMNFEKGLAAAVNCHSMENVCNTPDFMLGAFLNQCFVAAAKLVLARDQWYGMAPDPVAGVQSTRDTDDLGLGIADVWHEGSGRYYRARLLEDLGTTLPEPPVLTEVVNTGTSNPSADDDDSWPSNAGDAEATDASVLPLTGMTDADADADANAEAAVEAVEDAGATDDSDSDAAEQRDPQPEPQPEPPEDQPKGDSDAD